MPRRFWFRFVSLGLSLLLAGCVSVTQQLQEPSTAASEPVPAEAGSPVATVEAPAVSDAAPPTTSDAPAAEVEAPVRRWFSFTRSEIVDWSTRDYRDLANEHLLPHYKSVGAEWYCNCPIRPNTDGGMGGLDLDGCNVGVISKRQPQNAATLSWEHVVPQSWLEEGARHRPGLAAAIRDPFNLIPASGALNGIRKAFPFAEIEGESVEWAFSDGEQFDGECDFELVKEDNLTWIEPPNAYKGDIARITLYMRNRYGFASPVYGRDSRGVVFDIDLYMEQMRQWADADPIDNDERARLDMIRRKVRWSDSPADY